MRVMMLRIRNWRRRDVSGNMSANGRRKQENKQVDEKDEDNDLSNEPKKTKLETTRWKKKQEWE